jgi:phosphoglucomutase
MASLDETVSTMILSHSGWRGIFAASGNEEDGASTISEAHRTIAALAGTAFAEYLRSMAGKNSRPVVLVGTDTRPTGKAIAEASIAALTESGCKVRYAGFIAAPEIMAWARSLGLSAKQNGENAIGFMYISASHNPIGHNGIKFGLADGGVLSAQEAEKLTILFRSLVSDFVGTEKHQIKAISVTIEEIEATKQEAQNAYYAFAKEVAWGNGANIAGGIDIAEMLKSGIAERPLGVCCDFNGSARCVSIDRDFFTNLGIQFEAINTKPGAIAHRIVPEGDSLDPCCAFLEEQHRLNPAFMLGYVPDCDGDRGNLVVWDESLKKARALEAQEVFSLVCMAELAQLAWESAAGGLGKVAVVVNDPSSLRVDRIAAAFGASVFRAEVGEANVVGLARKLRKDGYTVRILGEASNGGTITHPSAVRDPLHTVLALAKLLSLRTNRKKPGLFELWCNASGQPQRYRGEFTLADIIASLPPFVTTNTVDPEAALQVASTDHAKLKNCYQDIFLREWEQRKNELKERLGIYGWKAACYNGMTEQKNIARFGDAGKGGLKIYFHNADGREIASLWMRGSATEPLFRILADAEGSDKRIERDLIAWQRRITIEADILARNI